jgi:hypothetical protein
MFVPDRPPHGDLHRRMRGHLAAADAATGPALTVGPGPSHRCSAVTRSQGGRVVTYGGGPAAGYIKGTFAMPAAPGDSRSAVYAADRSAYLYSEVCAENARSWLICR